MEIVGGLLVGGVLAIGLAAYFRRRNPATTASGKIVRSLAILLAAAAAGGAVGIGGKHLRASLGGSSGSEVDGALSTLRNTPLVGVVLADHPELEAEFRAAIERDLRNPRKEGPPEAWKLGADLRQRLIAPALRNTDDALALKAVEAMRDLLVYLQRADLRLCRELGLVGIQNVNQLDRRGSELFRAAMAAQEAAYRAGRTAAERPRPSNDEVSQLLRASGYTTQDFQELSRFEHLAPKEGCDATAKLYGAPSRLPLAQAGSLSRWVLTIGL